MAKQTFTIGQVLTAAQMTSLQQTAMGGGSTTAKTASYTLVAADAGTVVQMNSASATTITVNTALFSAGDTVQIQNIGAGVCTVTAGTATVSTAGSLALSQYEGGQLYFNTTSAALFFDIVQTSGMTNPLTTTGDTIYSSSGTTPARLGIGTNGQVLTVASGLPSWATSSAGTVIKVVYGSTTTSTSISSTSFTDTTLTASITPTANTSKVLVLVSQQFTLTQGGGTGIGQKANLVRGSTNIFTQPGAYQSGYYNPGTSLSYEVGFPLCLNYLDSPATTSSTTYKLQLALNTTANSAATICQHGNAYSTMILLEIGA